MNPRYLGVLLGLGGLLFLSACGDDNDADTPKLAANITAAATTLTVTSAPFFPTSGGAVQIDAEWIGYASKAGDTLSGLTRGVQGTTPAAHAAGALVILVASQAPNTPTITLTPRATATSTIGLPTDTPTPVLSPTITATPQFSPTITLTPQSSPTRTPQSPTPTPTRTTTGGAAVCGNGAVEAGEECDDGNVQGGDGCAANCAREMSLDCTLGCIDANDNGLCGEDQGDLDDLESGAITNGQYAVITLVFHGDMSFIAGRPRDTEVKTVDPDLTFPANQIPTILKPTGMRVDPIPLVGISCNCAMALAGGEFGPDLSGEGVFGCNESGLSDVDYTWTADHDISAQDPTCATGFLEDGGSVHPHAGACNDVGKAAYYGGGAPRDAMTMSMHMRINLAPDAGKCVKDCSVPDFGPDCLPCTEDDEPTLVIINTPMVLTTGSSFGKVEHANYWPPPVTVEGVVVTGREFSCDSLEATLTADPNAPAWNMAGGATVSGIGLIDTPQLGDATSSVTLACVPPGP
jgi:cysteine-rich repeat protein